MGASPAHAEQSSAAISTTVSQIAKIRESIDSMKK